MLGRLLHTDIKTYLVELLMKQDQMSMSASIESRVPFLDHQLVEFAARLPDRLKLRGFTTKRILREADAGTAARCNPRRARKWASPFRSAGGREDGGSRSCATCCSTAVPVSEA